MFLYFVFLYVINCIYYYLFLIFLVFQEKQQDQEMVLVVHGKTNDERDENDDINNTFIMWKIVGWWDDENDNEHYRFIIMSGEYLGHWNGPTPALLEEILFCYNG